jgi:protease PrsW
MQAPTVRPWFPVGPLPKKIRKVGAPLGVIIALGTVTGLVVILLTAANPVGTAIGFVLASVAIGVYFALHRRNTVAKVGCILLGYAGAVIMHALWNGSALFGVGTYFLVYLCWMVPVFGLAIWLAIASRRREQRIVAAKLPGMVSAGLVTPNEATWLSSIRSRKLAIGEVTRFAGKPAAKGVKNFAAQIIELAFVRDRIDRGFGDPRVHALLNDETYGVYEARAAAPVLQSVAAYRAPGS